MSQHIGCYTLAAGIKRERKSVEEVPSNWLEQINQIMI
jgi:hypothetical protein